VSSLVSTSVESEISGRQMRCLVVLLFSAKQAKVLFDFLILAFHFAVILEVVGSSEAGLDTKMLVEGSHEMSSKLWAAIREDLLWDPVEAEYIGLVDVSSIFSCKV
jgi:hypothetical protein